ncbi:hypothetical protein ABZ436_30085 [Micromonospora matsumotoense]|uniref:hypothetical protein n=1 Tax=Micromonospora matsumotoense TaxID=121616 RepID=UPI0033E30F18
MSSEPRLFEGALPRVVSGVEHEYKWLVTGLDLPDSVVGTDGVLTHLGGPEGFAPVLEGTSKQSSIYLDTVDCDLAAALTSLAVIVNYGRRRDVRWLTLKETLLWAEGRRDSLEIGELIGCTPVSQVLQAWAAQPLTWLTRGFGRQLDLRPYGAITQRRQQVLVSSTDGSSLGLSLDETTTRDGNGVERAVDRWLEVETSQSDLRSLSRLAAWARTISDRLGVGPYEGSKPERTAELVGRASVG